MGAGRERPGVVVATGIKGKEPQERQATWSGRAKAQRFSLPQPLASTPRFTVFSQVTALLPDTKSILSYV